MATTTATPLRDSITEALIGEERLRTQDIASLIEHDDLSEVREALFSMKAAKLVQSDEESEPTPTGARKHLVWTLGAPPKAAKKAKGKAKAAKSGPAESNAHSLRLRISEREDGSYSVIVRRPGVAKVTVDAGQCDDAAEAGSVALSKVIG